MKKTFFKITILLIMSIPFVNCFTPAVFAAHEAGAGGGGGGSLASKYSGSKTSADSGITYIINMILAALQIICTAGAVAMLMWMGAKYMLASASERADLKKNLVQYAIGAVIMFAAGQIMLILKNFVTESLK
jgi:hypothetical protein